MLMSLHVATISITGKTFQLQRSSSVAKLFKVDLFLPNFDLAVGESHFAV